MLIEELGSYPCDKEMLPHENVRNKLLLSDKSFPSQLIDSDNKSGEDSANAQASKDKSTGKCNYKPLYLNLTLINTYLT